MAIEHVEPWQKMQDFMARNARPLDWVRLRHEVDGTSKEEVLRCLAAYQNEDGGFGHGLEPDCWNPGSSPIQTWAATEILVQVGVDTKSPILSGIWAYLGSDHGFEQGRWLASLPSFNEHPHAPWWTFSSVPDILRTWGYNPSAALAGFVLGFGCEHPFLEDRAVTVARAALAHLEALDLTLDMHECACYLRLLMQLQKAKRDDVLPVGQLEDLLRNQVRNCLSQDTKLWQTDYVCRPSNLLLTPGNPFFPEHEVLARKEAKFIMTQVQEDGSFALPWKWDEYPEAWAISQRWWQGQVILQNIQFVRAIQGKKTT